MVTYYFIHLQICQGFLGENSNFIAGRILSAKRIENKFYSGTNVAFKSQLQCEVLDSSLTQFTLTIEDTQLSPAEIEFHYFFGLVKQWQVKKITVSEDELLPLRLSNNNRAPFALLSSDDYKDGNLVDLKESSTTAHGSENHCQYESLEEAKEAALVCVSPSIY